MRLHFRATRKHLNRRAMGLTRPRDVGAAIWSQTRQGTLNWPTWKTWDMDCAAFARQIIAPALPDFINRYPDIVLRMARTDCVGSRHSRSSPLMGDNKALRLLPSELLQSSPSGLGTGDFHPIYQN